MPVDTTVCEVVMPRLSDTMSEGIVGRWHKGEGDAVTKGEPIAEIETDKVTVELEAPADGTLLRMFVTEGGAIAPGGVVAVIGPEGAAVAEFETELTPAMPEPKLAPPPQLVDAAPVSPTAGQARIRATPLARRLAAQAGLDLSSIGHGSGSEGRILRQDVERKRDSTLGSVPTEESVILPTRLHMTIARRMTAAKQDVPHYYLDATADVTRLLELRSDARDQESPLDVPVTAYVMRAVALALREFPRVNSSWVDETIVLRRSVNVGLAVAVADDGLVVPVIKDADLKGVAELAAASAELVVKARDGNLTAEDMSGGSFTISNLGMFGVDVFHAIINPPESGILAVGGIRGVATFQEDSIVRREVMQLSLSADHRVYSGVTAAAFLTAIRSRLEQPLGLLC